LELSSLAARQFGERERERDREKCERGGGCVRENGHATHKKSSKGRGGGCTWVREKQQTITNYNDDN
jgi:hypothetical protein